MDQTCPFHSGAKRKVRTTRRGGNACGNMCWNAEPCRKSAHTREFLSQIVGAQQSVLDVAAESSSQQIHQAKPRPLVAALPQREDKPCRAVGR